MGKVTDYQIAFGQRLQSFRNSLGMSLNELSKKTEHHISTSSLSRMEKGEQPCSCELVLDIADKLGVKPELLLYGDKSSKKTGQIAGLTRAEQVLRAFKLILDNLVTAYQFADDESEAILHLHFFKALNDFAVRFKEVRGMENFVKERELIVENMINDLAPELENQMKSFAEAVEANKPYKEDPEKLAEKQEMIQLNRNYRSMVEDSLHAISSVLLNDGFDLIDNGEDGRFHLTFLRHGPYGEFADAALTAYDTCSKANLNYVEGRRLIRKLIDHYVDLIHPNYWDGDAVAESEAFFDRIHMLCGDQPELKNYPVLTTAQFEEMWGLKKEGEE